MTTTQQAEITEGAPMSYTAHDGTVLIVSVAGPIESIYTLTISGDRIVSDADEYAVRAIARRHALTHNARMEQAR